MTDEEVDDTDGNIEDEESDGDDSDDCVFCLLVITLCMCVLYG